MNAIEKPIPSSVLMKAFDNACNELSVSRADKRKILGVNTSTLTRKSDIGFSLASKTGELQLHFIRLYRSLFAISGGDKEFMRHWCSTKNNAFKGVPMDLCQSIQGLLSVNQYLDAMRGKI